MCDLYMNSDDVDRVILYGRYGLRNYEISTFGGHPCAYVSFPESVLFENFSYDDVDIPSGIVHEGLSAFCIREGSAMIGWDYGHSGDYNASKPDEGGKKWDIPSIMTEIIAIIDYLNDQIMKIPI